MCEPLRGKKHRRIEDRNVLEDAGIPISDEEWEKEPDYVYSHKDVKSAVEFYKKYADNFMMWAEDDDEGFKKYRKWHKNNPAITMKEWKEWFLDYTFKDVIEDA